MKTIKVVKDEDEGFWNIAQERKKTGEFSETAEVRIQDLIIDDNIQKKARMIAMAASTHTHKNG